jgi:hypothetical protein
MFCLTGYPQARSRGAMLTYTLFFVFQLASSPPPSPTRTTSAARSTRSSRRSSSSSRRCCAWASPSATSA